MHISLPHSETSHAANPSGAVNRLPRIPLRNRFATAAVAAAIAVIPLGAATTIATAAEHPVTTVAAPTPGDRGDHGDGPRHDRQRDQRQERRDQSMTLDELLVGWNSSQIHQM